MANIIMVVTNEPFIARSQLSYLSESEDFETIEPYIFQPTDGLINSAVTAWKSISTDEEVDKFISINRCNAMYNIIYVPFSALCFTVAKDRANNNQTDRYMIVSIKETYKSCLIDLGLYSLFMDSRKKIPLSLIREFFDNSNKNILLDSEYDVILTMAKKLYQKPNHGLICDKISLYLEMTT